MTHHILITLAVFGGICLYLAYVILWSSIYVYSDNKRWYQSLIFTAFAAYSPLMLFAIWKVTE